jgi:hypothetical protein
MNRHEFAALCLLCAVVGFLAPEFAHALAFGAGWLVRRLFGIWTSYD